ncbi:hypothetical protein [Pseudomonas cremoricolorata]|uniref:hypothetical protein n=1 Tax=Pseudomonas cremoricolorata TaxID=157783 RepID=UPI0012B60EDF|nr:hypothetical protein [Pseudomonas cremoricolorata]
MTDLWNPTNGIYTATAPLLPVITNFPSLDIGVWSSALISAGFGAGFGAWMAGRIARNAKLRDELLSELRAIDVALTLSFSALNVAGSLKKQFISAICEKHKSDLEQFEAYKAEKNKNIPFSLNIENLRIQKITPPISELQSLIFGSMNVSPNGVRSLTALADSVSCLNNFIDEYNAILEKFKNSELPEGFTSYHFYLGIPVKGVVNNEYGTSVQGMAVYVNDILFFARKLADCLTTQGFNVRDRFKKLTGEKRLIRRLAVIDDEGSLIPPDSDYEGWMRGWEEDSNENAMTSKFWHRKKT